MYAYLRGTYRGSADGEESVLLEVAGVGYEIVVPPIVRADLSQLRPDVELIKKLCLRKCSGRHARHTRQRNRREVKRDVIVEERSARGVNQRSA